MTSKIIDSSRSTIILTNYLERVLKDTRNVDFAGIIPKGLTGYFIDLEVPLDKIYIRIQAAQEKKIRAKEHAERLKVEEQIVAQKKSAADFLLTLRTLGQYFYSHGQSHQTTERPESVNPENALKEYRRLFILGAPGAGKSTLLRYLARKTARHLNGHVPILVSLRKYAKICSQDETISLRDFALHQAANGDLDLRQVLDQHRHLLWLVDGLDEAQGWKEKIISQISYLQGDLILTSRPFLDYQKAGLESLANFEILPLAPKDVESYLYDWFEILSVQLGADSNWIEARISWIKAQLADRPRIQALTRNPLLLTFLTILATKKHPIDLPSQRAELYRRYVEQLLGRWEALRRPRSGIEGKPSLTIGSLTGKHAQEAALSGFYYIGWHLHRIYHSGSGKQEPAHDFFAETLSRHLGEEWGLPPGEAKTAALEVLDFWLEAGLLYIWDIRGKDYLAFRHLTFGEYVAGRGLAQAWEKNPKNTWKFLQPRLHHYAWREPFLMLAGLLDESHLNELVRCIVSQSSSYENVLFRDLRLVAALWSEGAPLKSRLIKRLIKRLRWLSRTHNGLRGLTLILSYIIGLFAIWQISSSWGFWIIGFLWNLIWYRAFISATSPLIQTVLSFPVRIWKCSSDPLIFIALLEQISVQDILLFVKALKDGDSGVRQKAAEALGRIQDPQAVAPLMQALKDSDPGVRQGAAEALGRIQDPQAVSHLIQGLKDSDSYVRRRAAEALGQIQDPQVVSPLIQTLKDRHWDVRREATVALGRIQNPQAVSHLIQALKDSHSSVRRGAALALGRIQDPQAVSHLIQALKDSHKGVRRGAAEALGRIQDPQAVSPLFWTLTGSPSYVRQGAIEALGRIQDPQAVSLLIQALKDSDSDVRQKAAEALGRIQDPQAVSPLIQALKDSDLDVRQKAAEALGRIQDPQAVSLLIQALKDSDSDVRQKAAEALGRIQDPQAVSSLIKALKDRHWYVRQRAAKALGHIQDPKAVPHLIQALKDSNPGVRRETVIAIKELADEIDCLEELKSTARALWRRITDFSLTKGDMIAKDAFYALEQIANRIAVVEVHDPPIEDPLASPQPKVRPRWLQYVRLFFIFLAFGISSLASTVISTVLADQLRIYLSIQVKGVIFLIIAGIILFILIILIRKLEKSILD